jgi:NADH dehydrogenase
VLPTFPEDLSKRAENALLKLGVRVRNDVRVESMNTDGVTLKTAKGEQQYIPTRTVLWAGGVTTGSFGRKLAASTQAAVDRAGRIQVNPDLTAPGFPEIFVVGDIAAIQQDGKSLPGVAQVAMQGGAYAARAVIDRLDGKKDLPPFRYFDRGDLAVIGRHSAVARIFGMHLWGWPAWMVWLFIHLMYIVQFQSRVLVFIQWGFQYLTFSRGARLITGSGVPESLTPGPMKNTEAS